MKNDDLLALALAGIAVWMIFASRKAGAAAPAFSLSSITSEGPFREVLNQALPGQDGWGWRYYNDGSNGVAIAPDGGYYLNGELVWRP